MKRRGLLLLLVCSLLAVCARAQQEALALVRDSNVVKQLFFSGLREKLNENYPAAQSYFARVVRIDPKNDAAEYEMATLYFRQDNLAEAETAIKRAIAIRAGNEWYWVLLAEIYKRMGKMNELAEVFARLIQIAPDKESYYFDRANAQFLAGNTAAASESYDAIENKFGVSTGLNQARQRLSQEKPVQPQEKATEPANTRASLKQAFENKMLPLDQKVKMVAILYPEFEKPGMAAYATELAQSLLKTYPDEAKVRALYGDVLSLQDKLPEAKEQYQAALKLDNQVYLVWEQLISIQTTLSDYNSVLKTGKEALEIYPDKPVLYYYLANALYKTGKSEPALDYTQSALQLKQNKELKAMLYALQGDIYINQRHFKLANEAFDRALAINPLNYLLMNNYAYYLALRNEDLLKAADMAGKATNAFPDNPSVADTYAYVLFKMKKYTEAQVWIEKALQLDQTKSATYLEHYGDILYFKGEKERALLQWQKAREAGNKSEGLNKKINEKKYFK